MEIDLILRRLIQDDPALINDVTYDDILKNEDKLMMI